MLQECVSDSVLNFSVLFCFSQFPGEILLEVSMLDLAGLEEGELSHRDGGSTGASLEMCRDLSWSAE